MHFPSHQGGLLLRVQQEGRCRNGPHKVITLSDEKSRIILKKSLKFLVTVF